MMKGGRYLKNDFLQMNGKYMLFLTTKSFYMLDNKIYVYIWQIIHYFAQTVRWSFKMKQGMRSIERTTIMLQVTGKQQTHADNTTLF